MWKAGNPTEEQQEEGKLVRKKERTEGEEKLYINISSKSRIYIE